MFVKGTVQHSNTLICFLSWFVVWGSYMLELFLLNKRWAQRLSAAFGLWGCQMCGLKSHELDLSHQSDDFRLDNIKGFQHNTLTLTPVTFDFLWTLVSFSGLIWIMIIIVDYNLRHFLAWTWTWDLTWDLLVLTRDLTWDMLVVAWDFIAKTWHLLGIFKTMTLPHLWRLPGLVPLCLYTVQNQNLHTLKLSDKCRNCCLLRHSSNTRLPLKQQIVNFTFLFMKGLNEQETMLVGVLFERWRPASALYIGLTS